MKILFVSNYEPWKLVFKGLMPSNHLFGIKETLTKNGGVNIKVDYLKIRKFSIKNIIAFYLLASKYDVVYDTINVMSKYMGLIPKMLRPFKIVTIMHHPPFEKQLKYSNSDAYIFFSQELLDLGIQSCKKKTWKMYLNEWRPDFDYYRKEEFVDVEYDFIDCGRTSRDHKTVVEALVMTQSKGLFFDKKRMQEQNDYILNEGINTFFYKDDFIPDSIYIKLIRKAKVMILALPKTEKTLGPLGATVFIDALGLEMPLICSNNAYCSRVIIENGLGLVYRAGDIEEMAQCMEKMKNESFYQQCKINIKTYNLSHGSMKDYSKKVMSIINNVINNK